MNFNQFSDKFEKGWGEKLQPFIEGEEMDEIYKFLKGRKRQGKVICPESKDTFRAFKECSYAELKVVFIGQDPYPYIKKGLYVADGLAFSSRYTGELQPSLDILYQAIEDDMYRGLNLKYKREPDLTYWAQQGILLLNSSLTVEKNDIGSHSKEMLWWPFMKYLIEEVLSKYIAPLVFVLFGKQAQELKDLIDLNSHWVLEVEHPSYANRMHRPMIHGEIFSKINILLNTNGEEFINEINWLKEIKP